MKAVARPRGGHRATISERDLFRSKRRPNHEEITGDRHATWSHDEKAHDRQQKDTPDAVGSSYGADHQDGKHHEYSYRNDAAAERNGDHKRFGLARNANR